MTGKHYDSIPRAENRRMTAIAVIMMLPIVSTVGGFIVGRSLLSAVIALAVSTFVAYVAFKVLDQRAWIPCPLCGERLRENYRHSPRGTSENVEHVCEACSARYIDGELIEQ